MQRRARSRDSAGAEVSDDHEGYGGTRSAVLRDGDRYHSLVTEPRLVADLVREGIRTDEEQVRRIEDRSVEPNHRRAMGWSGHDRDRRRIEVFVGIGVVRGN